MRLPLLLTLATLLLPAQVPKGSEVQERRLSNGARLLVVERKGTTAFHATLAFRGGRVEEPTHLVGATDLLAAALYGASWPEDFEEPAGLDTLLDQEDGLLEALRLERRRPLGMETPGSHLAELEARLQEVQANLARRTTHAALDDLVRAQGGRQSAEATEDGLYVDVDLPQGQFGPWCEREARRLRVLGLSRLAACRAGLLAAQPDARSRALDLLRGTALPGHPYGRSRLDHRPILEALRRSDLRSYARHALRPDRLMVVVVGGVGMDQAFALLDRTLGALPTPPEPEAVLLPEVPTDLGDRRVHATLGQATQVLVGWRIPTRIHPDHLGLSVALRLLTDPLGRLQGRLAGPPVVASPAEGGLDQPGGRFPGLATLALAPAEGHSPAEVESLLHGEVLRLQEDPIPLDAWSRALAGLEAAYLAKVDAAAAYAQALAQTWVTSGDWRVLEQEAHRLRSLRPEAVQLAVRRWLRPDHRTTVVLEAAPDVVLDPQEAELRRVLTALAARRIDDPARREQLVAEGLKQLRMLSGEERLRTLKLLAAQLPAEKP